MIGSRDKGVSPHVHPGTDQIINTDSEMQHPDSETLWHDHLMPIDLRGIQVFIATPGGLDDERAGFRKTMTEFNEDEGFERGVTFIPVGWELARPGVGRPQEKINEDVAPL